MSAVDVVRCLSSFVGPVKQAAIFRVPQQQLSQLSASPSNGYVEGCISFLSDESRGKKGTSKSHNIIKVVSSLDFCHAGVFS